MTQYKLSYNVHNDKVEVVSNNEIELAASILDMERDVGIICYGVKIETGDFNEDFKRQNKEQLMNQMIHHCKVLKDAYKKQQM